MITREMIEIAQAVMPGSADSPARAAPGRNPPAPHSPADWSSYEVTTPAGDDLRWEPVRQKRQLTSELPDFPATNPFDAASRPAQARGRARRSGIGPGPGAAPRP